MKTQYFIIAIFIILQQTVVNAQTVTLYTPKGASYDGEIFTEMNPDEITRITNEYRNGYSAATVLAPASRTYNCHSYAWHMTCGGSPICWINNLGTNLTKQWTDGSYVETTAAQAEKVYYYNGDHSAITITSSGDYTSKWGQAPLMRHSPGYGPSGYNMSYRKYYKRAIPFNPISGPTLINNTETTFSLASGLGSPHYVTWTCSPNLEIKSSTITNIKIAAQYNGKGWVQANVHGRPITHNFWNGTPILTISGPSRTPNGQYARFVAEYDYLAVPTSFAWILNPLNGNSVYGANSAFLDVAFYNAGNYQLVVRATNANGVGEYCVSGVTVYNPTNSYTYQVYPNPTADMLYVGVQTKDNQVIPFVATPIEEISYQIRLYNGQGTVVRQSTTKGQQVEFNVSNLLNGFYYLHIYAGNDKKPEIHKVVIAH